MASLRGGDDNDDNGNDDDDDDEGEEEEEGGDEEAFGGPFPADGFTHGLPVTGRHSMSGSVA